MTLFSKGRIKIKKDNLTNIGFKPMTTVGMEPQISQISGNHSKDCVIVDVTMTFTL
jgi:hypothetical protein